MHMCRCVSCTSACPFHGVIRLRANRAAVRQPVQAPPPCHSRLRAGILGCLMLGYCVAVPPRRYPSPPSPRRIPHQVRDDRHCLRRCTIVPLCTAAPHPHGVIPGLTRNPGLPCAGYCATASPVPILALAPQDPVSEHGVTGREENAGTKGYHTQKPPETFPFPAG